MPLLRILGGGWRWIVASVFLFGLGIGAGWWMTQANPQLVLDQLQPVIERLTTLGGQVGRSQSPFERFWIIYRNNAQAVSVMLLLGAVPILGALVPAVGMFGNGLLLGIIVGLGSRLSPRAVDPMQLFIGLAPHGIFELPAIWLAAAWAMKLSLCWLTPPADGDRLLHFRRTAREAIIVLGFVMILLLVAAAIEGNVTLALVRRGQSALGLLIVP